eukprot:403351756
MTLVLTAEELANMKDYKHQADKTTMETFYVNKLLVPIEAAFPSHWSANTITLIGQVPILLVNFYLWTHNVKFQNIDNSAFIIVAIALQWFSLFDVMDGMRARRLKCGSPLGRIIDEALDQVSYACVGSAIGYMLRLETPLWMCAFSLINVPFYSMEIKHTVCRHFKMIIGEIGPVELELVFTIIFGLTGSVFGIEVFDLKINYLFGTDLDSLRGYQLKHLISGLIFILMVVFTIDNLKDAFQTNFQETFRLFIPVFVLMSFAQIGCSLPSFQQEPAVAYFLYQMVFAIVILKLMLLNMASRPFTQLNVQYIYPLLPIILYKCFGISDNMEILVTRSCMVIAIFEFYYSIYEISKQYIKKENISFFSLQIQHKRS